MTSPLSVCLRLLCVWLSVCLSSFSSDALIIMPRLKTPPHLSRPSKSSAMQTDLLERYWIWRFVCILNVVSKLRPLFYGCENEQKFPVYQELERSFYRWSIFHHFTQYPRSKTSKCSGFRPKITCGVDAAYPLLARRFFANFQRRARGRFRTHLRPAPNFPARKTARDGGGGGGVAVKLWPRTPSSPLLFLRKFRSGRQCIFSPPHSLTPFQSFFSVDAFICSLSFP